MKKVLIISFYFSDQTAIASVRIRGLARFLPKFGWKPFILTSKLNSKFDSNIEAFEAPFQDISSKWKNRLGLRQDRTCKEDSNLKNNKYPYLIRRLFGEVFAYPDEISEWRKPAIEIVDELIQRESFDAMISSSAPVTCNIIAKDLKEKYNLPWLADFRDLWTQNHNYHYSKIRRSFERQLELKTLSKADALTTVSQPLATKLKQLHLNKKVYSIPNGFDPNQKNPGLSLPKKFTITYTGTLYNKWQSPVPLFLALRQLISDRKIDPNDLSVEFYGNNCDRLEGDVKRYRLDEIVKIKGLISREESIEKQRCSHQLLLLTWNNPDESGIYTGKIFDYLAAGRPIISIGSSGGVVEDLLRVTNAGFHSSSPDDVERIIMNAYNEYKTRNTVSYCGISSEIDKFSHVEMARKFCAILDKLVMP